jgi:hypothetical protein
MEVIWYLYRKIEEIWDYLVDESYTEEQLAFLKKIGCVGIENERPYDFIIVMGSFVYYALFCMYVLLFVSEETFIGRVAGLFCFIIGMLCITYVRCKIEEDNERMRKNARVMRRERRRMEM